MAFPVQSGNSIIDTGDTNRRNGKPSRNCGSVFPAYTRNGTAIRLQKSRIPPFETGAGTRSTFSHVEQELPGRPPFHMNVWNSSLAPSQTPTAKGREIANRRTGPPVPFRPASAAGEPILKEPADATIVEANSPCRRQASGARCVSVEAE